MTRTVIGAGISMALLAMTAACSGSSSASLSPAAPSTSAFSAHTFSAGTLTTLDHGHSSGQSDGQDGQGDTHNGAGNGHEAQLEGVIASVDATHKTIVVGTTTVNVLTATVIRRGDTTLTFADLKVADRVHVKGAANGTAIDAREIILQNDGQDVQDAGEAAGVVSGLAGTCPAITFTVGTTKVATNASTTFGRSACTDVVNGGNVEVKGTVQTDGSILATRVSIDQHETDSDKD